MTPTPSSHRDTRRAPPAGARLLLWLALDRAAHESIVGDLEEEFVTIARGSLGPRRARRWFWRQAVASIGSRWSRQAPAPGGTTAMPALMQDLRYGVRQLLRAPGFTLAAAATLALGIAATTTIFGLVHALVLGALPYRDAGRVVFLLGWDTRRDQMTFNLRYADATDLAAQAAVFPEVAVYRGWNANLSGDALPERVLAYHVTANTFELLGVRAAIGRTFAGGEATPGQHRVVVLSHGLWTRRYGADPGLVGRSIALNGVPYEVIGVMPRAFEFPIFNFKGDLWTPLPIDATWTTPVRAGSPWVVAIARLAAGASVSSAQATAAAVMTRLEAEHPEANRGRGVRVVPMGQLGTEQSAPAFILMSVAVVVVLLIACANVANLLLARSLARSREIAVRAALGAGRWRLVRQLLAESALLALAGGALGVLLAWWALAALRRAVPAFVLKVLPGVEAIRLDGSALVFTLGLSLVTVLVFGLLPAWQAVNPRLADALRTGGRAAGAARRTWLRSGLVVVEVSVSAALLVTTGLLGRSVHNLLTHDPGFDKDRVLALSVSLPASRYATSEARERFVREFNARVGALPGVDAVGVVNTLPFSTSNETTRFRFEAEDPIDAQLASAGYRLISGDYFTALGMPLLRGRVLTDADDRASRPVAVVNRAFARQYAGGGELLGRRIEIGDNASSLVTVTIVGVVGDVQHWTLVDEPTPEIYVPYALEPRASMSFAVRAATDPSGLANPVRSIVAAIDSNQALFDVAPMSEMVANSLIAQTLASSTMQVFGVAALVLSSLGLYGVLGYLVGQRTQEIGVRVALGASRGHVLGLVARQSLRLVAAGLVLGLGIAAATTRALATQLFGVGPLDPITYAGAAAVLALVAFAAACIPARRALAVDPVVALRID